MAEDALPGNPISVLVVDEPAAATRLGQSDASVSTVATTDAGIDALEQEAVDCVVAGLPDDDALALLERVRERAPDVPFVLYADGPVTSEALSRGVTDIVHTCDAGADDLLVAAVVDAVRRARARQARQRFDVLFNQLTQPTVEVEYEDDEPIVRRVNPAFEETFGYDASDLVGSSLDAYIVPPDQKSEATAINDRVQRGGALDSVEVTRQTADGDREFLLQNAVYEDGSGGFAIYTDITERRARKRELERQNERLDRFASVVSHDLRNPLNVAIGRVELARERHDGEHLAAAATAHDRMESLVEDLLALARQGDAVDDAEPVDLRNAATTCWATVATSDATLSVETDRTVLAAPSRLHQLLENLFRNSVEHGSTDSQRGSRADDAVEHAGEDVTVTVGDVEDGFYVADDGFGIPPEERDRVFESGVSLDEGGTGLGLAVVAEITRAHGWTVDVAESETGGARFEFTGVGSEGF